MNVAQGELDRFMLERRRLVAERQELQTRLDEISDLLIRFDLLLEHYNVDIERLEAIRESGSMFTHVNAVACPLCGALPEAHHLDQRCEGDVEAIVVAADVEIAKIDRLKEELSATIVDVNYEAELLGALLQTNIELYEELDIKIQRNIAPEVGVARVSFSELVEKRSSVQRLLEVYDRVEKLENKKLALQKENEEGSGQVAIVAGIPESITHVFSQKVSSILKAWNFPGECHVYFDKQSTDFVIDGKPRGSRGKGLRAITHAAATIGLMEYCQEKGLSHPGFVVLDSPLLAYFKPEGDEELILKGTDLKERFYEYLIKHHSSESQVIIIENQHPPENLDSQLNMTVFTGNPNDGRVGLL